MMIGSSGDHFSLSWDWRGNWAVYFPQTRCTNAVSLGFAWRPVGVRELRPFVAFFVINIRAKPYGRMWHLRSPNNIIRIGEWGCWNATAEPAP